MQNHLSFHNFSDVARFACTDEHHMAQPTLTADLCLLTVSASLLTVSACLLTMFACLLTVSASLLTVSACLLTVLHVC